MFSLLKKLQKQTNDSFILEDQAKRMKGLEEKRKQVIAEMGDKWVLHPSHAQKKLDTPRGF